MKPEEFLSGEDTSVEFNDYKIREDGTIVAWFYISSDDYEGELELTKEELKNAIEYVESNDGCPEVLGNLCDGIWMIGKAQEEPDPLNPDINRMLEGSPPKLWVELFGSDDPAP